MFSSSKYFQKIVVPLFKNRKLLLVFTADMAAHFFPLKWNQNIYFLSFIPPKYFPKFVIALKIFQKFVFVLKQNKNNNPFFFLKIHQNSFFLISALNYLKNCNYSQNIFRNLVPHPRKKKKIADVVHYYLAPCFFLKGQNNNKIFILDP